MRRKTLLFLLFLSLLWPPRGVRADGLMDLVNRADVICIASYDSHKWVGEAAGGDWRSLLTTYAVTMNVKALWKGSLPGRTLVLKLAHREHFGLSLPFRPFSDSRDYLVFARRQSGSAVYVPIDPEDGRDYNGFESALPTGPIPPQIRPQTPLLFKVVRQMLAGLWTTRSQPYGENPQQEALGCLQSFDWLYVDGSQTPPDLPPGISTAELKALLSGVALPRLLALTKDADAYTRFEALETAAWLQQTQVLPDLAAMAESNFLNADAAGRALFYFQNKPAEPLLARQLRNKNPQARLFSIEALERFWDHRLVPFLIDAAADPDKQVQERALYALYEITKLPADYALPSAAAEKQEGYAQFWKAYGLSHRDDLGQLWRQLEP